MITNYKKQCPSCDADIYFISKQNLKRAIKTNSKCRKCCMLDDKVRLKLSLHCGKSGEKNGMFGKKHSKKSRELMSINTKIAMNSPEIVEKMFKIKSSKEYRTKLSNSLKGRKFSDITKSKMRHSAKIRVIRQGFPASSYNPDACKIIDEYGKQNGYNFQHAMNGGEFKVKIGRKHYYIDGYDIDKNVSLEVDENFHKYQKDKDIKRQNEIQAMLNCKFIRISFDDFKE